MATTISPFLHQSHINLTLCRSTPQSPLQITDTQNVQHNLTMHFLTFRRIASFQHKFRFNQIRVNPINNTLVSFELMAEQSNNTQPEPTNTKLSDQVKDNKETEKSKTETAPTPPEKPLPGDCCGNGCVPCVWDTYFEELEEYNRLCKEGS